MSTLLPSLRDCEIHIAPHHEDFRAIVKEFVKREIEPLADQIDKQNEVPLPLVQKAAQLGLLGITFPPEYGGSGGDSLSMAIAIEEMARVSAATSTVIMASYLVSEPLYEFGTEDQKHNYLIPLAKGDTIGAHAMTEPAAGSDVAGIQSTARLVGNKWVLNGRKIFITNGDKAHIFLVFARTSPPPAMEKRHLGLSGFLIERGTPGFQIGSRVETIGLRGSQPVELLLDNVEVPPENLLGREGDGARIALSTYDRGRIGVAAQGVGIAQAAYEAAANYASTRVAFESPLLQFQQVQFKLADIAIDLHAARLLTYWAATQRDQGRDFIKAASIAKVFATEAAEKASLTAMMIHGGYGVATQHRVERYLRDTQIIKTYEGANDIQRLTIARQLIRELRA